MTNQSFKEAYGVLQRHAQTLRGQKEPNIDDLLGIVTESVGAYKVCKERIDAVEKALEKALSDTGSVQAPVIQAPAVVPIEPAQESKSQVNPAYNNTDIVDDKDVPF